MAKTNSEATGIELFATGDIYWAKVHKPDEKFGKYGVDLVVDQKQADEINAKIAAVLLEKKNKLVATTGRNPNTIKVAVVPVKMVEHPGEEKQLVPTVKASRRGKKDDGTVLPPVLVIDSDKKPITVDVGNGSKGKLKFTFNVCDVFDEQFGETKVYASLRPVALQVTELKEYKKPAPKIDPVAGF